MRKFGLVADLLLMAVLATSWQTLSAGDGAALVPASPIVEALDWLRSAPDFDAQYDYEMTVRIRLLLFWISRDDVGGGYIRIGQAAGDPQTEIIKLLFGSDPARAHGINRWGAGTEVAKLAANGSVASSAFLGFMKSSQGESVGAMRQELSKEKAQGKHRFEAIISRVDAGHALAVTVPFYSDKDFEFRDFDPAETVVLDHLQQSEDRKTRTLSGPAMSCDRSGGFLSAVRELCNKALAGNAASLCYIYSARLYTVTLEGTRPVPEKSIEYGVGAPKQSIHLTYRNLKEARFQVDNHSTGARTNFSVLLGTDQKLRGAPIQINYQPNWWFQVTLNVKPPTTATKAAAAH